MNEYYWTLSSKPYIAHYGVKGMQWGIRQWQYADGTYTPAGYERYFGKKTSTLQSIRENGLRKTVAQGIQNRLDQRQLTKGSVSKDRIIKSGYTMKRIQTNDELENHAFYATHTKEDNDRYQGLFGDNLSNRAKKEGKNVKVYQLSIKAKKNLSIPSDENVVYIMRGLMKDKSFSKDVYSSIKDSAEIMKRPQQQKVFKRALRAINKGYDKCSVNEQMAVWQAFNISLTNHNEAQVRSQNVFYGELKKKGYEAILDYNDKNYSSYHAKDPIIVFDNDSVSLKSVDTPDKKVTHQLNVKYNKIRIQEDAIKQVSDALTGVGENKMYDVENYLSDKLKKYLAA